MKNDTTNAPRNAISFIRDQVKMLILALSNLLYMKGLDSVFMAPGYFESRIMRIEKVVSSVQNCVIRWNS